MPKETMSSRERWLAVLHREVPDRLPMGYWATDEASECLMQYLQSDSMEAVYQRLHIDPVFTVSPKYIGPSDRTGHLLPPVGGSKNIDMYGCGFTSVDFVPYYSKANWNQRPLSNTGYYTFDVSADCLSCSANTSSVCASSWTFMARSEESLALVATSEVVSLIC